MFYFLCKDQHDNHLQKLKVQPKLEAYETHVTLGKVLGITWGFHTVYHI